MLAWALSGHNSQADLRNENDWSDLQPDEADGSVKKWSLTPTILDTYAQKESIQEEMDASFESPSTELDIKRFKPLRSLDQYGFDLNPIFESNMHRIARVADLSYEVIKYFSKTKRIPSGRGDVAFSAFYKKEDQPNDWDISVLSGKTGQYFNDAPGVLVFNRKKSILIIGLHGTANLKDWISNFDFIKATNKEHQLEIPGALHRGFSIKVSQFRKSLKKEMAKIWTALSKEERSNLIVFITGHSQGGALAHLTGELMVKFFENQYGEEFKNTIYNKVQLFRLSSPRTTGDDISSYYLESRIGRQNDISQYVGGDVVTTTGPGHTVHLFVKHLSESFSGYNTNGSQARQLTLPTMNKSASESAYGWNNPILAGKKALMSIHLAGDKKANLVNTDTANQLSQGLYFESKPSLWSRFTSSVKSVVTQLFGFRLP